jgi:prepilin-type N-terminal cleavage/methylation domain-containing protein
MRRVTGANRRGFTLTEITIAMTMVGVVILSVGTMLVDSQRGWSRMYNRVNNGVVSDGYVARRSFDAVVRKSSIKRELVGADKDELEVYYYEDPETSTGLDRYARFYVTDGEEFVVDYGELDAGGNPQGSTHTVTLASNVQSVYFAVSGASVQMTLELNDGDEALTVTTSAIRHHE